jgi:hypothetical protein
MPALNAAQLDMLSKGSPDRLGALVSAAGATINNNTTAAPFVLELGAPLMLVASAQCFVRGGISNAVQADVSHTAANFGIPLAANVPYILILKDTEAFLAAAGPAAFNLAVFRLR